MRELSLLGGLLLIPATREFGFADGAGENRFMAPRCASVHRVRARCHGIVELLGPWTAVAGVIDIIPTAVAVIPIIPSLDWVGGETLVGMHVLIILIGELRGIGGERWLLGGEKLGRLLVAAVVSLLSSSTATAAAIIVARVCWLLVRGHCCRRCCIAQLLQLHLQRLQLRLDLWDCGGDLRADCRISLCKAVYRRLVGGMCR